MSQQEIVGHLITLKNIQETTGAAEFHNKYTRILLYRSKRKFYVNLPLSKSQRKQERGERPPTSWVAKAWPKKEIKNKSKQQFKKMNMYKSSELGKKNSTKKIGD